MTDFLEVAICGNNGKAPTRGTCYSAGYDLYSTLAMQVRAGVVNKIPLGISIATPAGTYGRIAARSGLAVKYGSQVLAGVIDADYRGEVVVIMTTLIDFEIREGDRIAQLVLEKYSAADIVVKNNVSQLGVTSRGDGGFGSTGN